MPEKGTFRALASKRKERVAVQVEEGVGWGAGGDGLVAGAVGGEGCRAIKEEMPETGNYRTLKTLRTKLVEGVNVGAGRGC